MMDGDLAPVGRDLFDNAVRRIGLNRPVVGVGRGAGRVGDGGKQRQKSKKKPQRLPGCWFHDVYFLS
jgi:hypothetical protein